MNFCRLRQVAGKMLQLAMHVTINFPIPLEIHLCMPTSAKFIIQGMFP